MQGHRHSKASFTTKQRLHGHSTRQRLVKEHGSKKDEHMQYAHGTAYVKDSAKAHVLRVTCIIKTHTKSRHTHAHVTDHGETAMNSCGPGPWRDAMNSCRQWGAHPGSQGQIQGKCQRRQMMHKHPQISLTHVRVSDL